MKKLYSPEPLFGLELLRVPAVEVEVIVDDPVTGQSLAKVPIALTSIVNILRKRDGNPPLEHETRWVCTSHLHPIPSVHA